MLPDGFVRDLLIMDINTFTILLFKHKSATELYELGLISGSKKPIKELEKLLPERIPRILDGFQILLIIKLSLHVIVLFRVVTVPLVMNII